MRHAIFSPPSGDMADPRLQAEVAAEAEANGWDGFFIWDHVLRKPEEPQEIADPWICLAVVAAATERLRIGTMITPITRRRPIKLARETMSLDHLSDGRFILGLGLGVDHSGELSKFDEVVDPVARGQRLDEGVHILRGLWSGERVDFEGEHFVARDVTIVPPAGPLPTIPMWFAARGEARKPVRRAARHEGLFPVDVDADTLTAMLDLVATERGTLDGFDVAVRPGDGDGLTYGALADLGVTWALTPVNPGATGAEVRAIAASSPEDYFTSLPES